MAFLFSMIVTCLVALSTFAGCSGAVEKSEMWKARRSTVCGDTLLNNSGVVRSPNYPSNYDKNLDCLYIFLPTVSEESRMKFYMCDFEVGDESCEGHYIEFSDGPKFCGNQTGSTFVGTMSSGVSVFEFWTYSSVTKKGFKIAYCADCYEWESVKALCSGSTTTSGSGGRGTTSSDPFIYPL